MDQGPATSLPSQSLDPVSTALYGFIGTALLLSFDRLRVFEVLTQHGPMVATKLADDLNLNHEALERALQSAERWGLVTRVGHAYKLAKAAEPMVDPTSEGYCGALLNHFRKNTVPVFTFLEEALRDGSAQWAQLAPSKKESAHAFTNIFETEEHAKAFHSAMWRLSYAPSEELIEQEVLEGSKALVDLGGGAGAFAIAAARRHPDLQVIVFDLPEVKPYCEANIHNAGLSGRVRFVAGDFWRDALPHADTYALGYILSDWNDNQCVELLKRVRGALPINGRAIVLERLLEDDRSGPFVGLMQDLAMMLETGGMHRTDGHYRRLLNAAGFRGFRTHRSSGDKHAVVGTL